MGKWLIEGKKECHMEMVRFSSSFCIYTAPSDMVELADGVDDVLYMHRYGAVTCRHVA
jgi:hypothetical protein